MTVEVRQLSKSFGDREVLAGLSLDIGREVFAFLGPNGAGKTTLVSILCGLLPRDKGEVSLCGVDPEKDPNGARSRIGLVTQETALYDYLTARENLHFHACFYGIPKREREGKVDECLKLAQLQDRQDDRVGTFSGGMKRRLALVRSLLHEPDVLILDEPTLGIDVQNREEIWNRILELRGKKTVWVNTNYMDEADHLADRCAIIDQGKIVALGSPRQLKSQHAQGIQVEAKIKMSEEEVASLAQDFSTLSDNVTIDGEGEELYRLTMSATQEASQLLAAISQSVQKFPKVSLLDLQVRVPTLDDVFLELTGKKLRD